MLTLSHICKSYHAGSSTLEILKDVSFSVKEKEMLAIRGRSGSGKSTVLNIISGLDRPDSGQVVFGSKDISTFSPVELSEFRLRNIGLVFQFFNFLPSLTLEQNVSMPGHLSNRPGHETTKRTKKCLELLQISHISKRLPHEVSGGELQRAAIARALFMNPRLILADEPTGNLDDENAALVFSLFLSLVKEAGSSLILVTHDAQLAEQTDRTLYLEEGTIRS
jgi:ABC-type lipoprotein export system ATPase subunit